MTQPFELRGILFRCTPKENKTNEKQRASVYLFAAPSGLNMTLGEYSLAYLNAL